MAGLTATLYRYRLPLRYPPAVRGGSSAERDGILLRLAADDGMAGWGDACPLPGWSTESLEQAEQDLRVLIQSVPDGRPDAQWVLGRNYPTEGICPSARFAFECAYLGLLSAQAGLGLRNVLGEAACDRIAINALMTTEHQEPPPGFQTYKAKVGRQEIDREAAWIRRLASRLPANASIRLDANRAWTVAEANRFADAVSDCPIEYLEEPLRDPGELPEFSQRSAVPLAVDETLNERGVEFLRDCPDLRAVVLKPSLNGGLVEARDVADTARQLGMVPVVTSGFESGVGIRALAQLAGAIVPPGVACGLDPYRWIAEDVVEPALDMDNGSFDLADLDRTIAIVHTEKLQEL